MSVPVARSVPAIVTAGDRGAARAIHGESKVYLEIDGRPLVAHVVAELQRVPEVSAVYVIGDRKRLETALAAPELRAQLRKPLHILEQWNNLYENCWQAFRHSLPGAPPEGRDLESEADRDHQVLYLSADLPFITAQEVSQFIQEGIATDASYVVGLSYEEALVPVGLSPGPVEPEGAVPITYFNLREGRLKQNNLHLARPARMGNRHYIEDMYEHRKQRKLTNMLGLSWRILSAAEGSASIVFFFLIIHLGGVADRHGYRWLADILRRAPSIERVRSAIGQLLDTTMAFVHPSVGGCAVDVDDENEFDAIHANFPEWRARVVARAEAVAGPLPLPERASSAEEGSE